ncbi:MAG: hypothetical protein Q4Q06_06665 [Bacteroidota bacterium]|nr:hypothetical protein [Bacteroidota bacterium]
MQRQEKYIDSKERQENNKRKLFSGGITLLLHLLVVLLLVFVLGLPYLDPPPAEQGVEISSGDLTDVGDAIVGNTGGGKSQAKYNPSYEESDNIATQNTEDAPITSKNSRTKNKVEKPKEPTVESDAMFPGKKNSKGNGEGSGSGYGSGENGSGGGGNGNNSSGSGYSLNGRTAKYLPKPESNKRETGNVVVAIEVNQAGEVVKAIAGGKGTTLMDVNLWRKCEQAAKKAKFSAKENAPEKQRGTITYRFVY